MYVYLGGHGEVREPAAANNQLNILSVFGTKFMSRNQAVSQWVTLARHVNGALSEY